VSNGLQPVLHSNQGRWELASGSNNQSGQGLGDSRGSQITRLWPDLLPERLHTVFPVVLALISGAFKRLGECLRGFLQAFSWERANRGSEFI